MKRRVIRDMGRGTAVSVLLAVVAFSSSSWGSVRPALADPGKLMWTIVDTPSAENRVILASEVNAVAVGDDGKTFYAVDIPNNRVYKSANGGVWWDRELSGNLVADGASLPVWHLAVAPDDVNFLVAITADPLAADIGPREVFISEDGGASWTDSNFAAAVGEYISCVDISMDYGGKRDIAIGTRTGVGTGRVYVLQRPGFGGWADQNLPASDVVALKFSPTYAGDSALVVVSATAADTRLHLGIRDTAANTTAWNSYGGYPVEIRDTNYVETSPTVAQLITADLELPEDFSGQTPSLRRYYVSTDVNPLVFPNVQSGVHRIDDTVTYWIRPPATAPTNGRISSIAYWGTCDEGILLAGEVEADAATGMVHIWRTSNPVDSTPTWLKSSSYQSPTGGAISGFANARVAWSPDGTRVYCGTSSANPTVGGAAWAVGQWPFAWTTGAALDESAFSVSPYTPAYENLLALSDKPRDSDIGNIWVQLGLIDTQINFLSDVAALEVPGAGEETAEDYDILYLASVNTAAGGVDSVWRSTSDPLGRTWERILCLATGDGGTILRVKATAYDEDTRSQVVAFADLGTDLVVFSENEGHLWHVEHLVPVTDLALAANNVMYILENTLVYRYEWTGSNWLQTHKVDTRLDSGHTIAVPLKSPEGEDEGAGDWVIVGEEGPPNGLGRVAYADFSKAVVKFQPPIEERVEVPIPGNAHVIADDRFEQNKTIYVATNDATGRAGKIYRWRIDESTEWEELEPPNNAFYGLAQRHDVLYGAWQEPGPPRPPEPPNNPPGVDRTLQPRVRVPPPPEWDDLTVGLPLPPNSARFTREPSSLKVSSNDYNSLWVIDDRPYNFAAGQGCLWEYTDIIAVVGPWTTTPPSGGFVPVDPVTGRAREINFGWRQLSYAAVYELQLAKDSDFRIRVLVSENVTPVEQLSPHCFFPAGGLVPAPASGIAGWGSLESNHTYYWRVRARAATTGEFIRSPWSATMYFTVMAGLPVRAKQAPLTLLVPACGARGISSRPGFSWTPMPGTTKYEFILAEDAGLTQVVVKTTVSTTAYNYPDKLDRGATYFWQVRAIAPVVSDPSSVCSFTVVSQEEPGAVLPEGPPWIPFWVWTMIAIYAALMVAIITLVMVRFSYVRHGAATQGEARLSPSRAQNLVARAWSGITMRIRRWRYLKRW
ncbi:MAG TPA: hypothetical protein EYP71_02350 [Dehalococcoidia bacterium]|nr:hypothetical protein [Dehalococcoidia bacterium]